MLTAKISFSGSNQIYSCQIKPGVFIVPGESLFQLFSLKSLSSPFVFYVLTKSLGARLPGFQALNVHEDEQELNNLEVLFPVGMVMIWGVSC